LVADKMSPHPQTTPRIPQVFLSLISRLEPYLVFFYIQWVGTMQMGLTSFISVSYTSQDFLYPERRESLQTRNSFRQNLQCPASSVQTKSPGRLSDIILYLFWLHFRLPSPPRMHHQPLYPLGLKCLLPSGYRLTTHLKYLCYLLLRPSLGQIQQSQCPYSHVSLWPMSTCVYQFFFLSLGKFHKIPPFREQYITGVKICQVI
jgi:hypothetical protein